MLARPGGREAGRNTPRVSSLLGVFAVRNWTKAAKEGNRSHGTLPDRRGYAGGDGEQVKSR